MRRFLKLKSIVFFFSSIKFVGYLRQILCHIFYMLTKFKKDTLVNVRAVWRYFGRLRCVACGFCIFVTLPINISGPKWIVKSVFSISLCRHLRILLCDCVGTTRTRFIHSNILLNIYMHHKTTTRCYHPLIFWLIHSTQREATYFHNAHM